MSEYVKKLFSKWYIYLGLLFFIDDLISLILNIEFALPKTIKYIFLISIFTYSTYSIWRDENKEKLQLILLLNGESIQLSKEAEELLTEVAKDRFGIILTTKSYSGISIQTNSKNFIEEGNARSMAKYKNALDELIDNNLVDYESETHYSIKEAGYKYIESLTK